MTPEQLEFAISQYLDGTLAPLERDTLEEILATDANARALLEEYRNLDAAIKAAPRPPAIAWDRLHQQLVGAVARAESPAMRSYSIAWIRNVQRIAVAASVLVVLSLGIQSYRSHATRGADAGGSQVSVVVFGPQAEPATSAVIEQIAIGPAPTASEQGWRYADSIVGRATVVMIDRAFGPVQDIDPMPY